MTFNPSPLIDDEDDFLASLDAEIAGVVSKSKLQDDKKKLLSKVRDRNISIATKSDIQAQIAFVTWQLDQIQWRTMASVAVFTTQHCDYCGSNHRIFLQHMLRQETTSGAHVTRWTRTPKPDKSAPCEVLEQTHTTHLCADCLGDHGFDFAASTKTLAGFTDPFTISPTYLQEEPDVD